MTPSNSSDKAFHYPGGNYFDDVRIDISRSHESIEAYTPSRRSIPRPILINKLKFIFNCVCQRLGLFDFFVVTGLKKAWFSSFNNYWQTILSGRPLTVLDFFLLAHDYRKKQQHTEQLSWDSPSEHIANWQHTSELYSTFAFVRNIALRPIVGFHLWKFIKPRSRILEYGCSLAPYYHCYREHFSHKKCIWTLADIPNFPFHYSKFLYAADPKLLFHTISSSDFKNPIPNDSEFDVIILTTVLEHLDDPSYISKYLLDRLSTGGILVFDYVISEGKGLDTPNALRQRSDCLNYILSRVKILSGLVNVDDDVSLVVAKKVA